MPARPDASEFLPLPFFPQENRPGPIDLEDAATALFLSNGDINRAAERLRVTPARLNKCIRKSPRLTRLQARLTSARATAAEGTQSKQEKGTTVTPTCSPPSANPNPTPIC